MMKSELIALVSHVPNPRANRRMNELATKYDVTLLYWNKGGESCSVQNMGNVKQVEINIKADRTHVEKRIVPFIKFLKLTVGRMKKDKPSAVYAERIDMLAIAWFYKQFYDKNVKIIFEIPDLPSALVDKSRKLSSRVVKGLVHMMEKPMYRKVDMLIVTSEKFYENYYIKYIPREKMVYLPNIPDLACFKDYKRVKNDVFTVGFIGVIRYPKQLEMLLECAKKLPIKVLLAGFTEACQELVERASKMENVECFGQYNYNQDIAILYQKCDAIFSVYDSGMANVNYALPNKLYEAVHCRKPIIVAKGTYLGEIVQQYGIGVVVDSSSQTELENVIERMMNSDEYNKFVTNCEKAVDLIDKDMYERKFYNSLEWN